MAQLRLKKCVMSVHNLSSFSKVLNFTIFMIQSGSACTLICSSDLADTFSAVHC